VERVPISGLPEIGQKGVTPVFAGYGRAIPIISPAARLLMGIARLNGRAPPILYKEAIRSIASASLTSRSVTPPASWVDSVTSTLL
jgi:hypothetical protein